MGGCARYQIVESRMTERHVYQIQRLDGYTDGKPSWVKVPVPPRLKLYNENAARSTLEELQAAHPDRQYRLRKVRR